MSKARVVLKDHLEADMRHAAFTDGLIAHLRPMTQAQRRKFLLGRQSPYPRHFYKYMPARPDQEKFLRDALVEGRLYLARIDQLNDPGELQIDYQFDPNPAKALGAIEGFLKRTTELKWGERKKEARRIYMTGKFQNSVIEATEKSRHALGICSLTIDPRHQSMWAHYANSHQGICLQYDVAAALDGLLDTHPVIYSTEPVVHRYGTDDQIESIKRMVFRKHPDYSAENEWRMVRPDKGGSYAVVDRNAIRAVILGHRTPAEVEAMVRALLNERQVAGASAPKVYRATLHLGKVRIQAA